MKTFILFLMGLGTALAYSFVSEGQQVTKLIGETVTFRCEVSGLESWQTVSWLNGTIIMFFGRIRSTRDPRIHLLDETGVESPTSTGNVYELKIEDLSVLDEGMFKCQINGDHPIEQEYSLTVNILPKIKAMPEEHKVDVALGEELELSCRVLDGKPEVAVTWTRDDDAPVFENDESFQTGENVYFAAVEKRHAGNYQCAAHNDAGHVQESFTVNVLYAPNVTVDNNLIHTGPGETVEIACHFDAYPQVLVSWLHNGDEINNQERTHITYEGKNGNKMIITGVKEEDLGVYLCRGFNDKGEDEAVIQVSALPFGLTILSEKSSEYSDSYTLEWQVGSVAPLIECNLELTEVNITGDQYLGNNTIPAQLDAMLHSYQISDLHANGTYRAELDCRNEFGSTGTEVLEFKTSEQHRPAPPPTTTPKITEETQTMKEMNTLDERTKENPNGSPALVANCVMLLVTAVLVAW